MRVITGDECGLLKESHITKGITKNAPESKCSSNVCRISSKREGEQTRARGVVALNMIPSDEDGDADDDVLFSFASLLINGSVETWEARNKKKSKQQELSYTKTRIRVENAFATPPGKDGVDAVVPKGRGSRPVSMQSNLSNGVSACFDSTGALSILNLKSEDSCGVTARYNFGPKGDDENVNKNVMTAFAMGHSRGAIGGRDRETVLFDIESGKTIWKGKNLPPDRQTLLEQQLWGTSISFLSQSTSIPNPTSDPPLSDEHLLMVGTAYKQVRIYDTRTQRRPILYTPNLETYSDVSKNDQRLTHRITTCAQTHDNKIVVGDTAGFINVLDLRDMNAIVGRYSGPAGSVRQMGVGQSVDGKKVLASVGLDRMLWVHNVKDRRVFGKVYLKQRLNCMLICPNDIVSKNVQEEDELKDYVDSDQEEESDDEMQTDEQGGENGSVVSLSGSSENSQSGSDSDGDSESDNSDDDSQSDGSYDDTAAKTVKRVKT